MWISDHNFSGSATAQLVPSRVKRLIAAANGNRLARVWLIPWSMSRYATGAALLSGFTIGVAGENALHRAFHQEKPYFTEAGSDSETALASGASWLAQPSSRAAIS